MNDAYYERFEAKGGVKGRRKEKGEKKPRKALGGVIGSFKQIIDFCHSSS